MYLANKEGISYWLAQPYPGRELATEFMERHRMVLNERYDGGDSFSASTFSNRALARGNSSSS